MSEATFRLGSCKQNQAWHWFEQWANRLSEKFSGDVFDVPLVVLAEWFAENEPMEKTIERCAEYKAIA